MPTYLPFCSDMIENSRPYTFFGAGSSCLRKAYRRHAPCGGAQQAGGQTASRPGASAQLAMNHRAGAINGEAAGWAGTRLDSLRPIDAERTVVTLASDSPRS